MKSSKNWALALLLFIGNGSLMAVIPETGRAAQLDASHEVASETGNTSDSVLGVEGQAVKNRSPSGITSIFFSCIDRASSNSIAIADCLSKEKEYQNARLNKTYKALLVLLSGKSKDELVLAERAWLNLKSKDEDFEAIIYGGEQIDNLQQVQNEVFRICERANVLDKYLDLVKNK